GSDEHGPVRSAFDVLDSLRARSVRLRMVEPLEYLPSDAGAPAGAGLCRMARIERLDGQTVGGPALQPILEAGGADRCLGEFTPLLVIGRRKFTPQREVVGLHCVHRAARVSFRGAIICVPWTPYDSEPGIHSSGL